MSEVKLRQTQYKNYSVDADGNVWSSTPWRGQSLRKMVLKKGSHGYPAVRLRLDSGFRTVNVHSLVCAAFHGKKPSVMHQVCHIDGNRENNRSDNLRWGTSKENAADRDGHAKTARGSRNAWSKLKEEDIIKIRTMSQQGLSAPKIGAKFGVKQNAINSIIRGFTWKHV